LAQRHAEVSDDDVERILRRDYPEADLTELRALIRHINVREKPRVVAACLKNAGGSSQRLHKELEDAPGYYREILSEAEYPTATKRWSSIDKLSDSERQRIYDKDWEQYQEWFARL